MRLSSRNVQFATLHQRPIPQLHYPTKKNLNLYERYEQVDKSPVLATINLRGHSKRLHGCNQLQHQTYD
ncbi:unnamed protein product [Absidia cylindrospora]